MSLYVCIYMYLGDPSLPRDLTYTLTFQNSTGYLLIYALAGTEYCCPGADIYCPNEGD